MAEKETGGPEAQVAQRLRRLRAAEGVNAVAFAARLDISAKRWNNFENGYPLSREIAIKLVQTFPGLTLDWLYLGRPEGLTVEFARRLGALERSEGSTRRRS